MSRKSLVYVGATIGSIAGGYLPTLWGADLLSMSSIVFSGLGGLAGIYAAFKLTA
jgi:hypothetical protein